MLVAMPSKSVDGCPGGSSSSMQQPRAVAPGCQSPAVTHPSHHRWFYIIYTTEGKSTALSIMVPPGSQHMDALAQETCVNGCSASSYNTAGEMSSSSLYMEKPLETQWSTAMSALLAKSVGKIPKPTWTQMTQFHQQAVIDKPYQHRAVPWRCHSSECWYSDNNVFMRSANLYVSMISPHIHPFQG